MKLVIYHDRSIINPVYIKESVQPGFHHVDEAPAAALHEESRVKYAVFAISVLALLMTSACARRVLVQPTLDVARYDRVAVLPFETTSILSTIGNQLADEIILNLVRNAPALDVIERTRIDDLLREQNLARSRVVDPTSAVSLGRLLGVRVIVTGSMSIGVETIEPVLNSRRRVAVGIAIMRLIDTETGKIIWSQREESQSATFLGEGQSYLNVKTDQDMIQDVVRDLARSLAQNFYEHYEYRY